MSKVICDICGTTYAETAAQCPICGCARTTTAQTMADSTQPSEDNGAYTYVKGGRFSKTNVRKRDKGSDLPRSTAAQRAAKNEEPSEGGGGSNKILVAIVIVLLLAIVAVAAYIGIRYLVPAKPAEKPGASNPGVTTVPPTTVQRIPCTAIELVPTEITFQEEGEQVLLSYILTPADTTDKLTFTTTDPSVATVDEHGKVVAVGGGSAVLTVTCGDAVAMCSVICDFGIVTPPTTVPVGPTVPEGFVLKLKYNDITISERYPDPVKLYATIDGVEANQITWTSDNPDVAAVNENGVVSAVGKGYTTIRAEFGDQKASCKVNISFDPKPVVEAKYKINKTDVSIKEGETFSLVLTDSVGAKVEVEWVASEEGYVSIDGSKIKGVAHTQDLQAKSVTVSCTVEEETYSCIIRVYAAEKQETTENG